MIGGDVFVGLNGTRIVNYDALLTYLEGYTLPGHTITVTIFRSGKYQAIQVTEGTQPT